ncbi:sensor histidine kinase [Roseobacteraceae bacterium NS-SX3]
MLTEAFVNSGEWQRLATSVSHTGRWVWDLDTDLCEIDDTLRELVGFGDKPKRFSVQDFLSQIHEEDLVAVTAAVEASKSEGAPYDVEFRFSRPNGSTLWLAGKGAFVAREGGRGVLIGVNFDVTPQKQAILQSELLAGEMSHRVKNVLTLVSSIYRMLARKAPDIPTLTEAFLDRINAIAALNDVIFAAEQRKPKLPEVAEAVLAPIARDTRVRRQVTDLTLNANAAQTIALVLNELMTNAIKHGALRVNEVGTVRLEVSMQECGTLVLVWEETNDCELSPPAASDGFGMQVLLKMAAGTFSGEPKLEWLPKGIRFECRWKADELAA